MRIAVELLHYVPNEVGQYIRFAAGGRDFNQAAAKTLSKQSVDCFVLICALFEFFYSCPNVVDKICDFKLISDIPFQWFNKICYVVRALHRYGKILKRSVLCLNPFQHVEQQTRQEITEWIDVVQFRFA